MTMKPIYIAAYHQSKFGKLFAMTVPEIVSAAVNETYAEIGAEPSAVDVGVHRRGLQHLAQRAGTARRV